MENNPLFTNKSLLNKEVVEKFNKFMGKKLSVSACLIVIGFSVVVGGLLCLANLFLGISVVGIGLIIGCPLTTLLIKDTMKKDTQRLLGGKKFLLNFEFFENEILIKAESSPEAENKFSFEGEEKIGYEEITKAVVVDTDIYVYRVGQANIVDQRGMTHGTAGELIEFLSNKKIKIEGVSKKG